MSMIVRSPHKETGARRQQAMALDTPAATASLTDRSGFAYSRVGLECLGHTRRVDRASLEARLAQLPARLPTIPFYSSVNGRQVTGVDSRPSRTRGE